MFIPGMNIPLGHEGTTWLRGAVEHMMVLSIVRKDCPAPGSNKDKSRVCSALLQILKQGFKQSQAAPLLRVNRAMEGYQPTAQAQMLSSHTRDTGYAPAHHRLNIIHLLIVTAG